MQKLHDFSLDMYIASSEKDLNEIPFSFVPGDRIFLRGDLGVGKSTLVRSYLRRYFSDPNLVVRSPTYTYYTKYNSNIFHFDLYRLTNKEDLLLIGADEIFQDPQSLCFIEWPEILEDLVLPTYEIFLEVQENDNRIIKIISHREAIG